MGSEVSWELRNWNGYVQSRETGQRHWRFHILWFSTDDMTCTVYQFDEAGETVEQSGIPIHAQGRITACGRKWSRLQRDH